MLPAIPIAKDLYRACVETHSHLAPIMYVLWLAHCSRSLNAVGGAKMDFDDDGMTSVFEESVKHLGLRFTRKYRTWYSLRYSE
jgi:hypothetical protein